MITIKIPTGYLATAVVADKPYTLDPANMTNEALLHVFEYGFQRIVNDKTGGKDKTEKDKDEAAKAMLDRLAAEVYARRKVGNGPADPITRHVRDILRAFMNLPANGGRKAEYKKFAESADRENFLDDWFTTMPEAQAAKVKALAESALAKELEQRKATNDLIAALADDQPAEIVKPADRETPAKKASKKKG